MWTFQLWGYDWFAQCRRSQEFLHDVPNETPAKRLDRAIRLNVLVQLGHVAEQDFVAVVLDQGKLRLHGWVYNIGEGQVDAYCGSKRGWVNLVESEGKAVAATATLENVESGDRVAFRLANSSENTKA